MRFGICALMTVALAPWLLGATAIERSAEAAGSPTVDAATTPACTVGPPEYYKFPMVSTKRVPGTRASRGHGMVTFATSPFGIALTPDGSYRYDFALEFERLRPASQGAYVVWVTTPSLDQIALVGEMEDPARFEGSVEWNKFLVVVTLEAAFDPDAAMWSGPIVIRGMSKSGMMHTMAGHGPFEQENCASYGYE